MLVDGRVALALGPVGLTLPTRSGSRWWWMGWCGASAGPRIELPGGRFSGTWVAGCEDHRMPAVVPLAGLLGRDLHGSGLLQTGRRVDAGCAGVAILVFRLMGVLAKCPASRPECTYLGR